jgi:hypothetical protein
MGAWGVKNFENDAAADFAWDVIESSSGVSKVINTITAFGGNAPVEEDAEEVLAAIEYIAAAKGNPSEDIPEHVQEFVRDNLLQFKEHLVPGFSDPDTDLAGISLKTIKQIRESSELKQLWEESEDYNEWLNVLDDLEKRVAQ